MRTASETETEIHTLIYHIRLNATMVGDIDPTNLYRREVADDLVRQAETLARWVRGEV